MNDGQGLLVISEEHVPDFKQLLVRYAEINKMIGFICPVEINTYMRGHP